jgi:hypothetical protein
MHRLDMGVNGILYHAWPALASPHKGIGLRHHSEPPAVNPPLAWSYLDAFGQRVRTLGAVHIAAEYKERMR